MLFSESDSIPVPRFVLWAALLLFLVLSLAFAQRRGPWNDEGWFASSSLTLVEKGYLGTAVIEPTGTHLPNPPLGIEQYTYWVLPLYLLLQAAWYKVLGFSPFLMRLTGVAWGLAGLWGFYRTIEALLQRRDLARLTVCLLAVDAIYINVATLGRMDMMAAALSWISIALYLRWRETKLPQAVLAGYGCAALACFTHHQVILGVVALLTITLYLDRKRITWQLVLLAALPLIPLAIGWAWYGSQRPDLFFAQLNANSAGRLAVYSDPLRALDWEINRRWTFYGYDPQSHPARLPLVLLPLTYLAVLGAACLIPVLRRQPHMKLLSGLTLFMWLFQTLFDGMKLHIYLIHLIPWLTITLVMVWDTLWRHKLAPRWALAGYLFVLVGLSAGSSMGLIWKNNFPQTMQPVQQALAGRGGPGQTIYGSPELGLYLGFDNLVDDLRLGYYTQKAPAYIVMDTRYRAWLKKFSQTEPDVYRHSRALLDRGRKIHSSGDYEIYQLTP